MMLKPQWDKNETNENLKYHSGKPSCRRQNISDAGKARPVERKTAFKKTSGA
jgi:hypothetical protein